MKTTILKLGSFFGFLYTTRISLIRKALSKEYSIPKGKISTSLLLSFTGVILVISSFMYLKEYYGYFDIDYSLYSSLEDGLLILYSISDKFYFVLKLFAVFMLLGAVFQLNTIVSLVAEGTRTIRNHTFVTISILLTAFILLIKGFFFDEVPKIDIGVIIGFFILNLLIFFCDRRFVLVYILFLIPAVFIRLAERKAKETKKNPITFNVKYQEDGIKKSLAFDRKCIMFIGRTSKSLYYENLETEEIRIIETNTITSANFPREIYHR